jgi:hypothetical protein
VPESVTAAVPEYFPVLTSKLSQEGKTFPSTSEDANVKGSLSGSENILAGTVNSKSDPGTTVYSVN